MAETKPDKEITWTEAQRAPIKVRDTSKLADLPKNVIAAELKSRIEQGTFQPNEQMVSLSTLMEMTGAAKNTCRAALQMLRDQHMIKTFVGYGTFVLPPEMWKTPDGE